MVPSRPHRRMSISGSRSRTELSWRSRSARSRAASLSPAAGSRGAKAARAVIWAVSFARSNAWSSICALTIRPITKAKATTARSAIRVTEAMKLWRQRLRTAWPSAVILVSTPPATSHLDRLRGLRYLRAAGTSLIWPAGGGHGREDRGCGRHARGGGRRRARERRGRGVRPARFGHLGTRRAQRDRDGGDHGRLARRRDRRRARRLRARASRRRNGAFVTGPRRLRRERFSRWRTNALGEPADDPRAPGRGRRRDGPGATPRLPVTAGAAVPGRPGHRRGGKHRRAGRPPGTRRPADYRPGRPPDPPGGGHVPPCRPARRSRCAPATAPRWAPSSSTGSTRADWQDRPLTGATLRRRSNVEPLRDASRGPSTVAVTADARAPAGVLPAVSPPDEVRGSDPFGLSETQ